jgi:hypothetical protein
MVAQRAGTGAQPGGGAYGRLRTRWSRGFATTHSHLG